MIHDDDVKNIAELAKLNLNDAEIRPLANDLQRILNYINELDTLDVSAIQPTSHVLPLKNVYRNDSVQPSLPQDEALSIAISKKDGFFQVPQIIE